VAVSFIGGGSWSTHRNHDLPQVTDKLYHIMMYQSTPRAGFELTMLVVIGTEYIHTSTYKSNYHTITAMTTLLSF